MPVKRGNDEYFTIRQTAQRTGLSPQTVARKCRKNSVRCIHAENGQWLLSGESVAEIAGASSIKESDKQPITDAVDRARGTLPSLLFSHPEFQESLGALAGQFLAADTTKLQDAIAHNDPEALAEVVGMPQLELAARVAGLAMVVRTIATENLELSEAVESLRRSIDKGRNE